MRPSSPSTPTRGALTPFWLILCAIFLVLAALYLLLERPVSRKIASLIPTATRTSTPSTTPSATPTPTSTLTPSITPTPNALATRFAGLSLTMTAQPTRTFTPTPTATRPTLASSPSSGPQNYQLRPWSEEWILALVNEAKPLDTGNYSFGSEIGFYFESLLYETFLRYPNQKGNLRLVSQLAAVKGSGYSLKYGLIHDFSTEPFRRLLEDALNNGDLQITALDEWAKKNNALLLEAPIPADNLFGDKVLSRIIKLTRADNWSQEDAVFIIRRTNPGNYQVVSLLDQWQPLFTSEELIIETMDLNGDNQDEVILSDPYGYCQVRHTVYEWDGKSFQSILTLDPVANTSFFFSGCVDLSFRVEPGNAPKIITTEKILSDFGDGEVLFPQHQTYQWNDGAFHLIESSLRPQENLEINQSSIDWAAAAGPDDEQAVQFLEAAVLDGPDDIWQPWGPAAKDFFTLKLASWYFRLNKTDQGLALLGSVRDHPAAPEYTMASRVANTFLSTYASKGYYASVKEVSELYEQELTRLSVCLNRLCDNRITLREWGSKFFDQDYEYSSYFSIDFNDNIYAQEFSLNQVRPASLLEFKQWITQNELDYDQILAGDLNQDGIEDWLWIRSSTYYSDYTGPTQDYYVYAVLNTPRGVQLEHFTSQTSLDQSYQYRLQGYHPKPDGKWINILSYGSGICVFHIASSGESRPVIIDLYVYPVLESIGNPLQLIDWHIEDTRTPQGQALVVSYNFGTGYYIWDPNLKKLVPTGLSPELQEQNIAQAEQSLFVDHDPAQAARQLKALLNQNTREPFGETFYDYDEEEKPILRPYLLYLLGLSSELSGDDTGAVQAYWQLWHDFPTSAFSIYVRNRLMPAP